MKQNPCLKKSLLHVPSPCHVDPCLKKSPNLKQGFVFGFGFASFFNALDFCVFLGGAQINTNSYSLNLNLI